jgi:hypothetical protein
MIYDYCWGVTRKIRMTTLTRERESSKHVQAQSESAKRLRFPLQVAQVPKSLNPFTRALAPPFIGR